MTNYGRKLRMGANIRRKGGKDDRVCRENKKISRESQGGIKQAQECYDLYFMFYRYSSYGYLDLNTC